MLKKIRLDVILPRLNLSLLGWCSLFPDSEEDPAVALPNTLIGCCCCCCCCCCWKLLALLLLLLLFIGVDPKVPCSLRRVFFNGGDLFRLGVSLFLERKIDIRGSLQNDVTHIIELRLASQRRFSKSILQ